MTGVSHTLSVAQHAFCKNTTKETRLIPALHLLGHFMAEQKKSTDKIQRKSSNQDKLESLVELLLKFVSVLLQLQVLPFIYLVPHFDVKK